MCSDSTVVTQSKRAARVRTNARGLCDSRNCVGDRRAPGIPSGIGRLFVACFKCSQCIRATCSWPAPRLTTCSNCASEERLRRPRTARRRYTGSLHLWIRAIEQRCTCLFSGEETSRGSTRDVRWQLRAVDQPKAGLISTSDVFKALRNIRFGGSIETGSGRS